MCKGTKMASKMIENHKKATQLVTRETLEQAVRVGNEEVEALFNVNQNDPKIDAIAASVDRLSRILTKKPNEMAAEGASNVEDYLDNAKMPQQAAQAKADVDAINAARSARRGERTVIEAAGSDGFVTDRDENGQPKTPVQTDANRYAAKKKKEAEEPVPAAAAPAPAPAPTKANPIDYIPTESLIKVIEDMPKEDDFAQNKQKQDALIELTNILKARPVLPPEPPKGQAAPAAPAPAMQAPALASAKKADGQIYTVKTEGPAAQSEFTKDIPQAQGQIPEKNAKGEPFGGKQAPPFGSEKKEEKKEEKTAEFHEENPFAVRTEGPESASSFVKEIPQSQGAIPEKNAVAPEGWEGTVKEMKKEKDIDNPWALAWSMKNKGYTPHAASFLLKRKGASYLAKKFAAAANGGFSWNQDTGKVDEGSIPEVNEAHSKLDDNTGIDRPKTELPTKFAGEMTTGKALKAAEDAQEKLKALYLDVKPICDANNSRDVREAVELVYRAYGAFEGAIKCFNKQQMQEEEEKKAQELAEKKPAKKSSFRGLAVAAAE